MIDVDLFAGPGGLDTGARMAGSTTPIVGFDISADACRTAVAAGHIRTRADLSTLSPHVVTGEVDGVMGSPTCRPWAISNPTRSGLGDPRGQLIHVPLRWVLVHRPRWTAWEITPLALPVFEQHAETLRGIGYSVWTGLLRAERYGVASTRKRAVLIGRRDGIAATEPEPTHARPVTMGEALGLDDGRVLVSNYGTGGDPKARGRRRLDQPAFTMTGKCGRNRWEWPDGSTRNLTVEEASLLQGFPPDYPWYGGSTSRQQQVGDVVPPRLAAAILRPLLAPALAVAA